LMNEQRTIATQRIGRLGRQASAAAPAKVMRWHACCKSK
jgi:hypothetical protein